MKVKKFICNRRLNPCYTQRLLDEHVRLCKKHHPVREFYPKKGKVLKFTNVEYQLPCPFFIVADMETILEPMKTVHNNPSKSSIVPV